MKARAIQSGATQQGPHSTDCLPANDRQYGGGWPPKARIVLAGKTAGSSRGPDGRRFATTPLDARLCELAAGGVTVLIAAVEGSGVVGSRVAWIGSVGRVGFVGPCHRYPSPMAISISSKAPAIQGTARVPVAALRSKQAIVRRERRRSDGAQSGPAAVSGGSLKEPGRSEALAVRPSGFRPVRSARASAAVR